MAEAALLPPDEALELTIGEHLAGGAASRAAVIESRLPAERRGGRTAGSDGG